MIFLSGPLTKTLYEWPTMALSWQCVYTNYLPHSHILLATESDVTFCKSVINSLVSLWYTCSQVAQALSYLL